MAGVFMRRDNRKTDGRHPVTMGAEAGNRQPGSQQPPGAGRRKEIFCSPVYRGSVALPTPRIWNFCCFKLLSLRQFVITAQGTKVGSLGPSLVRAQGPQQLPGPAGPQQSQPEPSTESAGRRCWGATDCPAERVAPQRVRAAQPCPKTRPREQGRSFSGRERKLEGLIQVDGSDPGCGHGPLASRKSPGLRVQEPLPPCGPSEPCPSRASRTTGCPLSCLLWGHQRAKGVMGSGGLCRLPDSNTCWMRMPSTAPRAPGTSPEDTATALWTEADMVWIPGEGSTRWWSAIGVMSPEHLLCGGSEDRGSRAMGSFFPSTRAGLRGGRPLTQTGRQPCVRAEMGVSECEDEG